MPNKFFTEEQQQLIIEEIRKAEEQTSGEIRLHIEPECKGDAMERAKEVFEKLGMAATELKNGVLFYVAYSNKKFAILGDKGIHEKVTQDFWDEEKKVLAAHFSEGKFSEGLCICIAKAGEKLKLHFPYQEGDTNELGNDISYGGGNE